MKRRNLYERDLLACAWQYSACKHKLLVGLKYYSDKIFHNIYFKYIEVPITTKCTLNCKECCNLIQYYQQPYHISSADIIDDIRKISSVAKGILLLRLLGGEPLLHPDLSNILEQILGFNNIKDIQIVTNGTLIFDERTLKVLKSSPRFSVDISNYEEMSVKKDLLIEQLENNHINYTTQRERIFWTAQADCTYRKRKEEQLESVLSKCDMDCISILNGKLHLCPRSSHGMDLNIVPDNDKDYYNLRQMLSKKEAKKKIYKLLNAKSIIACNYCDVFRWRDLPEVKAAEQISKKEADKILKNINL